MLVGYYIVGNQVKSPRNAQFPYHVYLNFDKDWPENVLKQRGVLGNRKYMREAFPHEVDVRNGNKRAVSYKYATLEGLLEDERREGCDEETIEAIRRALL